MLPGLRVSELAAAVDTVSSAACSSFWMSILGGGGAQPWTTGGGAASDSGMARWRTVNQSLNSDLFLQSRHWKQVRIRPPNTRCTMVAGAGLSSSSPASSSMSPPPMADSTLWIPESELVVD